jgi:hypothetical protein
MTDLVVHFAFDTSQVRIHGDDLLYEYVKCEAMFFMSYDQYHRDALEYGVDWATEHALFRKELGYL